MLQVLRKKPKSETPQPVETLPQVILPPAIKRYRAGPRITAMGVTDHSLLSNLLVDKHTQYALADKSRPSPWVSETDVPVLTDAKYPNALLLDGSRVGQKTVYEGTNITSDTFGRLTASAKMPSDDPTYPNYAMPHIQLDLESPIGTFLSTMRWRILEPPLKGFVYDYFDGTYWNVAWLFDMTDADYTKWCASINARLIPSTDATFDLGLIDQRWQNVYLSRDLFTGQRTSLPTASVDYRGCMVRVEGGTGVADKLYMCMKAAAGTYSWVQIASG